LSWGLFKTKIIIKNMRYLITMTDEEPFMTDWYSNENYFVNECGMVVYDLYKMVYTDNGKTWKDIPKDHL